MMRNSIQFLVKLTVFVIGFVPTAVCQAQALSENHPSLRMEFAALDFLSGEWQVEVNVRLSKNGPWEKSEAKSTIQKAVGGTVYEEELIGSRQGRAFVAQRWIANDNRTGLYQQVFADSEHGVLVLYEGKMENDSLILDHDLQLEAGTVRMRLVYSELSLLSFSLQSMRSVDGGKTWDTTGTSRYRRIN